MSHLPAIPAESGGARSMLAKALGWFSIGLGMAEMVWPSRVANASDTRGSENVLRAYGIREAAVGAGLLVARNPTPWLWARVIGDVADLATLALRLGAPPPARRGRTVAVLVTVGLVTLLDVHAARGAPAKRRAPPPLRAPVRDYSARHGLPARHRDALSDAAPPAHARRSGRANANGG